MKEKLEELKISAKSGNNISCHKLGCYYCNISKDFVSKWGIRSAVDAPKGLFWLEKAALSGHIESQRLLGKIYLNGPTILADFSCMLEYFIKKNKNIVFRDINKGVKWLERAGSNGDYESIYFLGQKYVDGIRLLDSDSFVKRQKEKGEKLLVTAANQLNDPYCSYELGLRYSKSRDTLNGQPGGVTCFDINYTEAEKWFEHAACLDYLHKDKAIFKLNLAKQYYYGDGVLKDYLKMKKWLENAISVSNNYTEAFYLLGTIYSDGLGVEQNITKANEYFSLVKESFSKGNRLYFLRDNFNMISSLFFRYIDSNGVPYNPSIAQFWAEMYLDYSKKIKKTHSNHRQNKKETRSIANRFITGNGVEKNTEFANKLLNM